MTSEEIKQVVMLLIFFGLGFSWATERANRIAISNQHRELLAKHKLAQSMAYWWRPATHFKPRDDQRPAVVNESETANG